MKFIIKRNVYRPIFIVIQLEKENLVCLRCNMNALSLCLLVAVAGSCAGQSIQQLLDHVGINNPTATEEIRAIFTRSNQHNVLSCLVNNVPVDGGRPCDARTATFRSE